MEEKLPIAASISIVDNSIARKAVTSSQPFPEPTVKLLIVSEEINPWALLRKFVDPLKIKPWVVDSSWLLEIYPKVPNPTIVDWISGESINPVTVDCNDAVEIYPKVPNPLIVDWSDTLEI